MALPHHMVRAHVMRLRRDLGDHRRRRERSAILCRDSVRYRLQVDALQVDAVRFEQDLRSLPRSHAMPVAQL
ncbi:hypothetical protein Asi02nite_65770 [Asanoa siamensis]|uniref:Uncharacterized protein n=1 Tax=Asanoa siamensis TaxID=926357 RepID=A0ABQ4D0J7_9ACTN|nr:hypothetical protein Asi02nite_65770 [Asanoa siamensis]